MSYGYFYFFLSTGGGDSIKSALSLIAIFFNNCPRCSKGTVFEGLVSLQKEFKSCEISFHAYQIGSVASLITTFFLCLFAVQVSFVLDRKQELSIIELAFSFTLLILILSALLLRINKYFLINRILELNYDEKK
ncbi:MAG: DUF983 domain-containing protein [Pseudomonadota bacterium]|nr:DUF983 domain-containing protein [Pseudomonadota bacterium]